MFDLAQQVQITDESHKELGAGEALWYLVCHPEDVG